MPIVIANPATPASWSNWDGTNDGADQTIVLGTAGSFDLTMERVSPTVYAVAYSDDTNGYKTTIQLLQISGTTVTPGSKYVVTNDTFGSPVIAATGDFVDDTSTFIVGWVNSNIVKTAVIAFNGTSVTSQGSTVNLESGTTTSALTIERLDTDKAIASYYNSSLATDNIVCVLSVSGTTITQGTESFFQRGSARVLNASDNSDDIAVLSPTYAVRAGASTHAFVEGTAFTISGTSVTAGSMTIVEGLTAQAGEYVIQALDSSRIFVGRSRSDQSDQLYGLVFTSSGGTVNTSTSSLLIAENTNLTDRMDSLLVNTDLVMMAYKEGPSGSSKLFTLPISGTTPGTPNPRVNYTGDYIRLAPTTSPNTLLMVRQVYPNLISKLINI